MTTYYVSSGIGNDNNAGTSATSPLGTLQAAANLVKPGDTVEVMNGTYSNGGNDVLMISTSGTAGAPITFEAAPGATPLIDTQGAWQGVDINASYITFNGFTLVGTAANYTLAQALAGSTPGDPTFNGNGIGVNLNDNNTPHDHIIIENNTIYNMPGAGIATNGADYLQILNNNVHDNAHWSAYGQSGISIFESVNFDNAPGPHIIVSGNTSVNNAELVPEYRANAITDGEGIILDSNWGYTGGFLVQNNTTHGNSGPGIETLGSDNAVITGNTATGDLTNPNLVSEGEIFINQSNNNTVTNNITNIPPPPPPPPGELVINGGFETGDFSGWSQSGNVGLIGSSPQLLITQAAHTGNNAAGFGSIGADGTISQNLTTVAGQTYTFDFWLANMGGGPNDFTAKIGGVTELHLVNDAAQAYTHYSYTYTATGTSTPLEFDFMQQPSEWHLDDVSVAPAGSSPPPPPPPAAPVISSFSPNTGGVDTTSTITLSGTGGPGDTVTVFDGSTNEGTVTVTSSGAWTFPENNAANGVHTFTATDTDANGTSAVSAPFPVTVNVPIESYGSTSLVQVGNNYFLYPVGGSSGPELSYNGAPVMAGQFGAYAPIAGEQTTSGYDIAWKLPGADSYAVWGLDSSGNFASSILQGPTSGTDPALESLEPVFQQDLNGDGVIGLPTTVIEMAGSTSLVQVGNNYFLYPVGGSSGPELSYNGAPVMAGQFGAYAPIAGEQTTSGYDIAWKLPGADSYAVWGLDSSGNFASSILQGPTSGTDPALESLEPVFQQDLNGDGVIGLPTTVIEMAGSTSLVQVGNNYFLYPVGGSSGPELSYNGAPVMAGQFGAYAPIAGEQTTSGYDIAWKLPGADSYAVWGLDSSGNFASSILQGPTSGTDPALESLEPVFQQDLNGDGVIGLPTTVIEMAGSTSLVQVGNNYFLYPVGGSSGPELSYNGAPVMAGQFGAYAPIAGEQTTSGYDIAWKLPGADSYAVWGLDSSGNFASSILQGPTSGTNPALESLEPVFKQDLNGDGLVGPPTIGAGEKLEVVSTYSGGVSFTASTGILELLNSSSFAGTVAGMTGQDAIDFADIDPTKVQQPSYSGDASGGTLTVTDGTHAANIALLGNYLASSFVSSSDGHGGTLITDPPTNQQSLLSHPHA